MSTTAVAAGALAGLMYLAILQDRLRSEIKYLRDRADATDARLVRLERRTAALEAQPILPPIPDRPPADVIPGPWGDETA